MLVGGISRSVSFDLFPSVQTPAGDRLNVGGVDRRRYAYDLQFSMIH